MLTLEKSRLLPRGVWEWWRIITYCIVGALVASIMGSTYFIYEHIYRTLEDAQTIIILNSNEQLGTINRDALQKAITVTTQKSAPQVLPPVRDIFNYSSSTPGPAATSTL